MRVHRSHKKSRKGCITCKSRRVKCDESFPICLTCERRGTPCFYKTTPENETQTDASASVDSTIAKERIGEQPDALDITHPDVFVRPNFLASLFNIAPPDDPEIARSVLLSEYFQRAAVSLTVADRSDTRSRIYLDVIPSLASRHTGVSEAIFAVAAISLAVAHSRGTMIDDGASYHSQKLSAAARFNAMDTSHLQQAHKYYGSCLRALQNDFASLEPGSIDAVIASSALMIIFELSIAQFDRQRKRRLWSHSACSLTLGGCEINHNQRHQRRGQLLDLDWMKHIRGLGSFMPAMTVKWPDSKSEMRPFFLWPEQGNCVSFKHLISSKPPLTGSDVPKTGILNHPLLLKILAEGREALAELRICIQMFSLSNACVRKREHCVSSGDVRICISALDGLDRVIRYFMGSSIMESPQILFRVFSSWIAQSEEAFLDLLSNNDVLALAIYSCFLVYMTLFEEFWWLGDLGVGTLRTILSVVDGCSESCVPTNLDRLQLQDLFKWPKCIFGVQEGVELNFC